MLQRRSFIHLSLLIVALIIIIYPYYKSKPDAQKVADSSAVAQEFLQLLDARDFEQAWILSSNYMKGEIPLSDWLTRIETVRREVGPLQQRTQTEVKYTKDQVEGVPEGEYMSFFYSSDFANHDNLQERVTLFFENNTAWRVAGYFVE